MNSPSRVLGVLGGMGPLASAHFMTRLTLLTPAERDQDHVPAVLWSDPTIPPRASGRNGPNDPLPALLRGVKGLRAAGCGAIVMPCNTAHAWYDDMVDQGGLARDGVPFMHIVDATADDLRLIVPPKDQNGDGAVVGIMAIEVTLAMRLYQDRLEAMGWRCIQPTAEEMRTLVTPAVADIKANRVAQSYAPLAKVAQSLAARGAQAVVLGCTEIPLGMQAGPSHTLGVPLVDSIDALARAAIRWARG